MTTAIPAASGGTSTSRERRLRPDVVLADIRMPRRDGRDVTRTLAGPDVADPVRVVVITTFDVDEYVYTALRHVTAGRPPGTVTLTDRELDVVRLIARARTNAEIAAELFVSTGTVKTHITHIQRKLGARNRVAIAAWAWESGHAG